MEGFAETWGEQCVEGEGDLYLDCFSFRSLQIVKYCYDVDLSTC